MYNPSLLYEVGKARQAEFEREAAGYRQAQIAGKRGAGKVKNSAALAFGGLVSLILLATILI